MERTQFSIHMNGRREKESLLKKSTDAVESRPVVTPPYGNPFCNIKREGTIKCSEAYVGEHLLLSWSILLRPCIYLVTRPRRIKSIYCRGKISNCGQNQQCITQTLSLTCPVFPVLLFSLCVCVVGAKVSWAHGSATLAPFGGREAHTHSGYKLVLVVLLVMVAADAAITGCALLRRASASMCFMCAFLGSKVMLKSRFFSMFVEKASPSPQRGSYSFSVSH